MYSLLAYSAHCLDILLLVLYCALSIQVLTYDPSSDTIEIVHYSRRGAQNDPMNVFQYRFLLYSNASEVWYMFPCLSKFH